jgi:hypothetical protein
MIILLSIFCLVLGSLLGVVIFYAVRWANIIFMLEDDLAEAIDIHERTVSVLEAIIKTPLFFDSPEIKIAVNEAIENVKICQTATQKLVQNFTQRSKQRYIRLIDNTNDEAD